MSSITTLPVLVLWFTQPQPGHLNLVSDTAELPADINVAEIYATALRVMLSRNTVNKNPPMFFTTSLLKKGIDGLMKAKFDNQPNVGNSEREAIRDRALLLAMSAIIDASIIMPGLEEITSGIEDIFRKG